MTVGNGTVSGRGRGRACRLLWGLLRHHGGDQLCSGRREREPQHPVAGQDVGVGSGVETADDRKSVRCQGAHPSPGSSLARRRIPSGEGILRGSPDTADSRVGDPLARPTQLHGSGEADRAFQRGDSHSGVF